MYSPTLVQDYENGTDQDAYVSGDSPVHFLQTLNKDELERLAEQSVSTIAELGEAEKETIMLARGGVEGEGFQAYRGGKFRHICPHKGRAERVLKTCAIAPDTIDGQGEEEGRAREQKKKRREAKRSEEKRREAKRSEEKRFLRRRE